MVQILAPLQTFIITLFGIAICAASLPSVRAQTRAAQGPDGPARAT